jgi:hypothetical protein
MAKEAPAAFEATFAKEPRREGAAKAAEPSRHFVATQHSVAFGAKRTFSDERLTNRIYEYAP